MVMQKRGLDAVIAVVTMILIVVAAIAVVWTVILPMINDSGISTSENAISIDTEGGFTLYDDSQKIACVQIKKESSLALEGLKVLFSVGGNSQTAMIDKGEVPALNQKRTYCFDLKNFGRPDSVTVVALPEDKSIPISSIVPVSPLSVGALSTITGGSGGAAPTIKYLEGDMISLTGCAVLNISNKVYRVANDIGTNGTCFEIRASGVTLDGNGKTITGDDGAYDYGVAATMSNLSNITIKNFGNIREFARGISLDSVNYSRVFNNKLESQFDIAPVSSPLYWSQAIYIRDGSYNRIDQNRISWNSTGADYTCAVSLDSSLNHFSSNNNIVNNSLVSFRSEGESAGACLDGKWGSYYYNIIENNVISSDVRGVNFDGNLVVSNVIRNNIITISVPAYSGQGIKFYTYSGKLSSNTVESNNLKITAIAGSGIYLGVGNGAQATNNFIGYNKITANVSSGIEVGNWGNFSYNKINYNTINLTVNSAGIGIILTHSHDSAVSEMSYNEIASNNVSIRGTTDPNLNAASTGVYMRNYGTNMTLNSIRDNYVCGIFSLRTVRGFMCDGSVYRGNEFTGTGNRFINVSVCGGWPVFGSSYTAC